MNRLEREKKLIAKLENSQIKYVSGFISNRKKALFKCTVCSSTFKKLVGNAIKAEKGGCPKCSRREKITNDLLDQRLSDKNLLRIGNCIGAGKSCAFKCLICDYVWSTLPSYIINTGSGCPRCNNKLKLTNEKIDLMLKERNIRRIGNVGINNKDRIKFECLKCSYIWNAMPNNVVRGTGCPKCISPKSEIIVKDCIKIITGIEAKKLTLFTPIYDTENNIIRKKIFIDFHFIWNNKTYFVEYNGIQHYEPFLYLGFKKLPYSEVKFNEQLLRDQFLRDYCKKNLINLIEIDGRTIFGAKIFPFLEEQLLPKVA